MDLLSVYRDVIAVQTGAPGDLVNEEMRAEISALARRSTPEQNLRRIDAIFAAREKMMEFNAAAAAGAGVDDGGAADDRAGGGPYSGRRAHRHPPAPGVATTSALARRARGRAGRLLRRPARRAGEDGHGAGPVAVVEPAPGAAAATPHADAGPGPRSTARMWTGSAAATAASARPLAGAAGLRASRRGETIELSLLKVPAGDPDGRVGSLVVNPGGPGGSGIDYAADADLLLRRPSSGRSSTSSASTRAASAAAPRSTASPTSELDAFVALDPDPDTAARRSRAPTAARASSARAAWRSSGDLAAHVSTVEAARDIDVIAGRCSATAG